MSTNRTRVGQVAVYALAGAETIDLGLYAPLLILEPGELSLLLGQRAQELSNERAHRAAALRRADARRAVHVVRD
ncbi:MAG TPA: hypothetical protein VK721_12800 [Solirubrobacteraceae bacterium]|nr:hypothetical protein [Solirubrobacteraceae bacterium]